MQATRRYVTIDYWASKAQYDAFLERFREDYAALDLRCEALTEIEERVGLDQ